MKIVFRVDASAAIGTGHLVRCLALADSLGARGIDVAFVCKALPENARLIIGDRHAIHMIENANVDIEQDARHTIRVIENLSRMRTSAVDWLVVDHYQIAEAWESAVAPRVRRLMVIDDLANRRHECDLILDQNFYQNTDHRYDALVPARCIKALGPVYALLRREFYEQLAERRVRDGSLHRILVAFGGSDPTNETAKVLRALSSEAFADVVIDVIIGPVNPYAESLRQQFAADRRVVLHERPPEIAKLMNIADLAIGAGGTMTWERCCMGLPAVVIVTAQNQAETADAMHRTGAIINLGSCIQVREERISATIARLARDPLELRALGERSFAVMAPDGVVPTDIKVLNFLVGS